MKPEKKIIELLTSIKTFQIAGLQIEKQKMAEIKKQTKLLEEIHGKFNRRKIAWGRFFGI